MCPGNMKSNSRYVVKTVTFKGLMKSALIREASTFTEHLCHKAITERIAITGKRTCWEEAEIMTLPLGGAGQDVDVRLHKKLEATDVDSRKFPLCVFWLKGSVREKR